MAEHCTAQIHHGPGHQSVSTCERTGAHEVHAIREQYPAETLLWVDEQARHQRDESGRAGWYIFSGIHDESPLESDEDPKLPRPECPACERLTMARKHDNTWGCVACGASGEALPFYMRDNPTACPNCGTNHLLYAPIQVSEAPGYFHADPDSYYCDFCEQTFHQETTQ